MLEHVTDRLDPEHPRLPEPIELANLATTEEPDLGRRLLEGTASQGRVTVGDVELDGVRAPDGPVLVGIRPEGLRPVGSDHAGMTFDVGVDVVEPLGDEVLVHGSIEGLDGNARTPDPDAALLADVDGSASDVTIRLPPELEPEYPSALYSAQAWLTTWLHCCLHAPM